MTPRKARVRRWKHEAGHYVEHLVNCEIVAFVPITEQRDTGYGEPVEQGTIHAVIIEDGEYREVGIGELLDMVHE